MFRRMVVERMKRCHNITALARELGLDRKQMYTWRDQLDPDQRAERPALETREEKLEREVRRLKGALADKTLEVDFFKGALQKVAAPLHPQDRTGASASSTKKAQT